MKSSFVDALDHKRDDKSISMLNRVVEWTSEGLRYEADQMHAEIIVNMLGLQGSKQVATLG